MVREALDSIGIYMDLICGTNKDWCSEKYIWNEIHFPPFASSKEYRAEIVQTLCGEGSEGHPTTGGAPLLYTMVHHGVGVLLSCSIME